MVDKFTLKVQNMKKFTYFIPGSSIAIRYQEPRKLIKLPLDLSTLSEAEKKTRLDARKPRKKIKIEDEVEDNFNSKKYLKYLKKK